ncbi:sodium/proton antiporter (CPA1 family) [Dietzia kunjamensis]|uniref:cation:proton antiporter n=1 Tax=Dietzia kunjamensis TaxID=322509 RepID=UPI000E737785|nr:cation:proton antiporter [Dietzia kunjamensis]MBB1013219.1 sodium:proton antiporter [Dietzia kunjamensis]RKE67242.1 sodium/proton antiporter (CPA1 family) [Dietzia kunjamensis]
MTNTDLIYAVVGAALLLGSLLPRLLRERILSAPIIVVGVGMLIGWLMPNESQLVDVIEHAELAERMAEITVIVALFGVGLALDRPLSFRGWTTTWRLLAIGMPLSIAGVALLGWWVLGVTPAVAVLLGAVLAPTDPVLASDVQVAGPGTGEAADDENDEARFALTSEAGLNDAFAFPFVYLAIYLATKGGPGDWLWGWLAWDLVGKTVIGAVAGWVIGRLIATVLYRHRVGGRQLIGYAEPAAAVATLLFAYGVGELVGGWGFLAVFFAALGARSAERSDERHAHFHEFVEYTEHLLTLLVLLVIGASFISDAVFRLEWSHAVVAAGVLFVIRPLTAWIALIGDGRLRSPERLFVSAFGVRGVGSLFYLCYAMGYFSKEDGWSLWPAVSLVIVASIVLHGAASSPAVSWLDRHRGRGRGRTPAP